MLVVTKTAKVSVSVSTLLVLVSVSDCLVLVSDSLVLITSLPAAVYDTKLYCLEEKAMQHRKLAKDKNLWHVSCAVYK